MNLTQNCLFLQKYLQDLFHDLKLTDSIPDLILYTDLSTDLPEFIYNFQRN